MELYYGVKKRKLDEISEESDDIQSKKIKLADENDNKNKMIYSTDTEIRFTEQINKITIETLIKEINKIIQKYHTKYVNTDKKLNITYIVDSPGGLLSSTFKFIDFISLTKKKYPYVNFNSIITGSAASGATLITICADKRQMTKLSSAMIHNLSANKTGSYNHLMSYSDHLKSQHEKIVQIYLNYSKCTREQLETFLTNETWMTSEQYLRHGFIDEIIE